MEAILDRNNSHDEKIHKANKLRERKNNESKRDWRDKGILWNLHPLYKIKVDPVDYID